MKPGSIIFSSLFLFATAVQWQLQAQERMVLHGKVLDEQTGSPVLFSKVWLVSGAASTYTDLDGAFSIAVPGHRNDSLAFSSLQYELVKYPVSAVRSDTLAVTLRRRTVADGQVLFKAGSPESLIRLAVEAIGDNYGKTGPVLEVAYRERLQIGRSQQFVARAEGLFEWHQPFSRPAGAPGRVGRFRGKRDSVYNDLLRNYNAFRVTPQNYPLSNGVRITNFPQNNARYDRLFYGYNPCFYHPYDLEELDAVRYSESFLNQQRVGQYQFQLLDYIVEGGETVLIIGFKPKNMWVTKAYFTGRLFIQPDDKAIVRAEFRLSPGELVYFNYNSKIETISRTYVVNYVRQQEQWRFDNGSIETAFIVRNGRTPVWSSVHFRVTRHAFGSAGSLTSIQVQNQPFVSQLPVANQDTP